MEKSKIDALQAYDLLPEDYVIKDGEQVVPIVLLFSQKRDKTFKARAIILGNQVRGGDSKFETF